MKKYTLLFLLMLPSFFSISQSFELLDIPAFSDHEYESCSTSWGDYDNDGDLDLFIANGRENAPNEFYINEGGGKFTSVSNNLTDKAVASFSAAWGDYDNDGWLDIYIANCNYKDHKGVRNFLFKNNGDGTFTKVINSKTVSHIDPSYASSWVDYDNDGWLDLYVVNAYGSVNRLYKNNGDGSFTPIYNSLIVSENKHEIGCNWSDFDNDGDVDLLVISTSYLGNNSMFRNNGDGSFSKLDNAITNRDITMCRGGSWADYNNDGWMDLLLINAQGGKDILFRNNAGLSFTEISSPNFIASEIYSGNAGQWGDFDNDGDLDMLLMHHADAKPEFHKNNGEGGFDLVENEWTEGEGIPWSLTSIDVNLDGRLDIFQANRYESSGGRRERNMLYLNTTADCSKYSLISLQGIESNLFGIGASVRMYGTNSEDEVVLQKREMSCLAGGGYIAQHGNVLHFGMRDFEQIDSIIVRWSSGIETRYYDLTLNKYYKLIEDGEVKIVPRPIEFSIKAIPSKNCPDITSQLSIKGNHNPVRWYKDGEFISNSNTINIPADDENVQYVVQDGLCGKQDSILINNQHLDFDMFPNPANDFVNFEITSNVLKEVNIKLFDASGRYIQPITIKLEEEHTRETIPLSLPTGTYFLKGQAGCVEFVEKLIVITVN